MIDLKLPKINAERLEDRVSQMQSFLYQHVEELDYALGQIQKDQDTTTEAIASVKNDDTGIDMVMSKVNKLGRTTTELKADADGIKTSVETVGERVETVTNGLGQLEAEVRVNYATKSELEQTSDEIMLKVTDELDGAVTTYELEYEPTLDNFPAWDFTDNLVCGEEGDAGYFECDDGTVFEYTNESYRKHARDVAFDTTSNQTYRFRREGEEWKWMPVADTDFGVAMKRIAELQVKAGEIDESVAEQTKVIDAQGEKITTNTADIKLLPKTIGMSVTETIDQGTPKKATITLSVTDGGGKVTTIAKDISFDGLVTFINSAKQSVTESATGYTYEELSKVLTGDRTQIDGGKILANSILAKSLAVDQIDLGVFQNAQKFQKESDVNSKLTNALKDYYTIGVVDKALEAKAGVTGGTNADNCSWRLTKDAFSIKHKGNEVLKVDGDGLKLSGNAEITGGYTRITKPYNEGYDEYITLQEYYASPAEPGMAKTGIGAGWITLRGIGSTNDFTISEEEGFISFYSSDLTDEPRVLQIESGRFNFLVTPCVGQYDLLTVNDLAWEQVRGFPLTNGQTKTFSVAGYNTLVLEGYVSGTAPYQTLTIPISMLTSSDKRYAINYGTTYLYANMKVVNGILTIVCSGSGATGVWSKAMLQK